MERERSFKVIAACGIAMSLQGCIAAAFPIAAGGLMVGGGRADAEPEPTVVTRPADPIEDEGSTAALAETTLPVTGVVEVGPGNASGTFIVEDERTTAPAAAVTETEAFEAAFPAGAPPAVNASERPAPAISGSVSADPAASEPALVANAPVNAPPPASVAPPTPLPPSAASTGVSSALVVPIPAARPAVAGGTFFDPLFAYAADPAFMGSETRTSAILRNPAMLEPDRADCTQGVSTVLIDLDPEEGELFPIDTLSASPAFADRLAQLRVRGVVVAWISKSSTEKMSELRVALSQTGLDPLGIDEVLLMRSDDDRKQSRRDELAQNSCLIAIAGDSRSDFHELFGYLLNPRDAVSLEPMIGEGWFLIPTPLLPERPTQ